MTACQREWKNARAAAYSILANRINGAYLRVIPHEISGSNSSEGMATAVAYLTWADELINFCIETNI
jgi:hypothetical protein